MSDFDHREKRFEADIEQYLLQHGGYTQGKSADFDAELGLDKACFLRFIRASQPLAWKEHEANYGAESEAALIERFCKEVSSAGLLKVLREGFTDRGVKFRAVFWQPESSLNAQAAAQYEANILQCTRQLYYSPKNKKSIDMVLLLNGIPVVSMELKCQFSGQNVSNALNQYRFDRAGREAIFSFKQRVLVHFAVDLCQVYMTTRLEGPNTYFLPFNQGSNGAGRVGGAGNPANAQGYASAYLWEQVLRKESLLEILQKYMHLQGERMIFPRYHQLDVVSKLLADVRVQGAGKNYLIQHSAGSGKSNSIAWLAHRLSGLHDANNDKIFHSVVIVSDRVVLDKQLQDTVFQFDHVPGVVQKVDENSAQLRVALQNGVPIIITTLHKFPVIYKDVDLGKKRFAVIIDEAHSSQTGTAAKKLKYALADTEAALKAYAEREFEDESKRLDPEDEILKELASHGKHENMSFFAFTATPKDKTLNMFGLRNAEKRFEPYHVYSMRQAIEEGFILDVLRNYMTYNMYFKIVKTIDEDPELDTTAGAKAVRKYQTLHPHNISQKAAVILDHFQDVTMNKMGGQAKAMIVTPSRLHAVRYFLELKRQIRAKELSGVDVLVAFSGDVRDEGETYSEHGLNVTKTGEHISEGALPAAFKSAEFNILVVAEKYQTGFDEPLLHTMFVDKKLSGVKAVQTLSRLNRTARGKQDTFVLDFVNSNEDIRKAFEPYYEQTLLENETNPNVIYDIKRTLDGFRVVSELDVKLFAEIFYSQTEQSEGDMGRVQATLQPALDRFDALEEEKQDVFKTTLARFNRIYSFVTQVCRMFDKEMLQFSAYAKFLAMMLPKGTHGKVELDDKILLQFYKLAQSFTGSIKLNAVAGIVTPITGETGRAPKKKDPLTVIIEKINGRYATEFTEMDKVLLQLQNDYESREEWIGYADSDEATFMDLFKSDFAGTAAKRFNQNDAFFKKMFNDTNMMKDIVSAMGAVVYQSLRKKKAQAREGNFMAEETLQAAEVESLKK